MAQISSYCVFQRFEVCINSKGFCFDRNNGLITGKKKTLKALLYHPLGYCYQNWYHFEFDCIGVPYLILKIELLT